MTDNLVAILGIVGDLNSKFKSATKFARVAPGIGNAIGLMVDFLTIFISCGGIYGLILAIAYAYFFMVLAAAIIGPVTATTFVGFFLLNFIAGYIASTINTKLRNYATTQQRNYATTQLRNYATTQLGNWLMLKVKCNIWLMLRLIGLSWLTYHIIKWLNIWKVSDGLNYGRPPDDMFYIFIFCLFMAGGTFAFMLAWIIGANSLTFHHSKIEYKTFPCTRHFDDV